MLYHLQGRRQPLQRQFTFESQSCFGHYLVLLSPLLGNKPTSNSPYFIESKPSPRPSSASFRELTSLLRFFFPALLLLLNVSVQETLPQVSVCCGWAPSPGIQNSKSPPRSKSRLQSWCRAQTQAHMQPQCRAQTQAQMESQYRPRPKHKCSHGTGHRPKHRYSHGTGPRPKHRCSHGTGPKPKHRLQLQLIQGQVLTLAEL